MMEKYSFGLMVRDVVVLCLLVILLVTFFSYFYEAYWRKSKLRKPDGVSVFDSVYSNHENTTAFEWLTDFCVRYVKCAEVLPALFLSLVLALTFIPHLIARIIRLIAMTSFIVFPIYALVQRYVFGVHMPNEQEIWIFPIGFVLLVLIAARGRQPYMSVEDETGKKKYNIFRHWLR